MPPRFAYWTIIAGGLPTSFRAAEKDELMPTFRRLKEKHPDAEMKYFARGKLWDSADEARRARMESGRAAGDRREGPPGGNREKRGRDWRPGGEHRDPRQRFKDAKKARNQDRREQRWSRKNEDRRPIPRDMPETKPHGDPLAPRSDRRPFAQGSRPGRTQGQNRPSQGGQRTRFAGASDKKPFGGAQGKRFDSAHGRPPRYTPHGDKLRGEVPRRPFKPSAQRRFERGEEAPPRPPRPDREPPPGRDPKPGPPPRPSEPAIKPPGPPERGHGWKGNKGPRKRRDEE